MDDLLKNLKDVGFPIAVVVYLLWERRSDNRELRFVITKLTEMVSALDTLVREKLK